MCLAFSFCRSLATIFFLNLVKGWPHRVKSQVCSETLSNQMQQVVTQFRGIFILQLAYTVTLFVVFGHNNYDNRA